jgi:hypothetical protein
MRSMVEGLSAQREVNPPLRSGPLHRAVRGPPPLQKQGRI